MRVQHRLLAHTHLQHSDERHMWDLHLSELAMRFLPSLACCAACACESRRRRIALSGDVLASTDLGRCFLELAGFRPERLDLIGACLACGVANRRLFASDQR